MKLLTFAVGVCCLVSACGPKASAFNTYYVSTTGNDSGAGTSSQPFRTISHGANNLQPGDTLLVAAGTYNEALIDAIPSGRDWNAPVTVKALNSSQRPVISPSQAENAERVVQIQNYGGSAVHHIILDGFVLDGSNVQWEVVKISLKAHDIRVQNSEASHAPGSGIVIDYTSPGGNLLSGLSVHDNGRSDLDHGIYVAGSYNSVVNSTVFNNAGWGIHVYSSYGPISNVTVQANTCYNNARAGKNGSGIGLYSGSNHSAIGNKVFGNRDGIFVDFGASNAIVMNNTVYDNRGYGIVVGSQATGTQVTNNILYSNGTEFYSYSSSTTNKGNQIK